MDDTAEIKASAGTAGMDRARADREPEGIQALHLLQGVANDVDAAAGRIEQAVSLLDERLAGAGVLRSEPGNDLERIRPEEVGETAFSTDHAQRLESVAQHLALNVKHLLRQAERLSSIRDRVEI